MARTFQAPQLFRSVTVLENGITGFHRTAGGTLSAILGLRRVRDGEHEAQVRA